MQRSTPIAEANGSKAASRWASVIERDPPFAWWRGKKNGLQP